MLALKTAVSGDSWSSDSSRCDATLSSSEYSSATISPSSTESKLSSGDSNTSDTSLNGGGLFETSESSSDPDLETKVCPMPKTTRSLDD